MFEHIARALAHGASLSEALRKLPRPFDSLLIALIEIGEESGTLSESLTLAAETMSRQRALRGKILNALLYPGIILVATLGVCLFLVTYAFPKIVPLFRGFRVVLPLPTRILIGITDFVTSYGWWLAGGFVLLSISAVIAFRFETVRARRDAALLHLPLIATLIRAYVLAEIARMLATLMAIIPALARTADAVTNRSYASALRRLAERANQGERLTAGMRHERHCFPLLFIHLTASGESTGQMSEMFRTLANAYEEELGSRSDQLIRLIEPLMMIGMGLVVGLIALAIISPMYRLTQDLPLS